MILLLFDLLSGNEKQKRLRWDVPGVCDDLHMSPLYDVVANHCLLQTGLSPQDALTMSPLATI